MDPDQSYWIQVWEDTLFWPQSGALLGRADPLIFGTKLAPCCVGPIHLFLAPKQRPVVEGGFKFGKLIYWIWEYSKVLKYPSGSTG
jgi:hypothetical protein